MKKKLLSACLCILVVALLLPAAFSREVAAAETRAGGSISTATTISMGTTYPGSISASNTQDYYKFTLATSGTLDLEFISSGMKYVYLSLYDASGAKLWESNPYWNSSTELINAEKTFYLTSGTYYFSVRKYSSYYGSYNFRFFFASAGETFREPQGGSDNSIQDARTISIGTRYKGQLAMNDSRDFYKFTISTSGAITLDTVTDSMKYVYLKIYDATGKEIWSRNPYWNSSTEQIVFNDKVHLTSGTYYLGFIQYSSYQGNYNFEVSFASAGESFKEAQDGSDNSIQTARSIGLNTTYKGQIALNDQKDFYKFTLPASDTITLSLNAYNMKYVDLYLFDSTGNQIWSKNPYWNSSTEKITQNYQTDLTSGTYYLGVEDDGYDGNYDFKVISKYVQAPNAVSGLKIGGRAADALRLNWNKSANADGYIVEQYKNGAWVRIARIGSGSTLTYRVENLSASTTYKFRVKAFAMNGSTAVYSGYTYVNGKTNPSVMTGVQIAGWASDALRINWNRNNSASGYIIEQYTAGKWVRIARISGNATTTYRVENLRSSSDYFFRIQAFEFDGSTALYSTYAYTGGTTL